MDDLLADAVPLAPAFTDDAAQVGAPPNLIEALVYPNETAACLAQLAPSAALVEVLDLLTPGMLEVDGQIDAVLAVGRHIGMLQARFTELLAALDAGDRTKDGFTRDHVAAALRMPPASMRTTMANASDLVGRLPDTLDLLRSGGIRQRHAIDLADATRSLTAETAAAVEATGAGPGAGADGGPVPGVGETGRVEGVEPRGGGRPTLTRSPNGGWCRSPPTGAWRV